jgi:hypothetical protein
LSVGSRNTPPHAFCGPCDAATEKPLRGKKNSAYLYLRSRGNPSASVSRSPVAASFELVRVPRGGKFSTCPCPPLAFHKLKTRGHEQLAEDGHLPVRVAGCHVSREYSPALSPFPRGGKFSTCPWAEEAPLRRPVTGTLPV